VLFLAFAGRTGNRINTGPRAISFLCNYKWLHDLEMQLITVLESPITRPEPSRKVSRAELIVKIFRKRHNVSHPNSLCNHHHDWYNVVQRAPHSSS